MGEVKTYSVNGKLYAIPTEKAESFKKDMPEAIQVAVFSKGEKKLGIPFEKVGEYLNDFPGEKPLYNYPELDSIMNTGAEQRYSKPQEAVKDTFAGSEPIIPGSEWDIKKQPDYEPSAVDFLTDIPKSAVNAGKQTLGSMAKSAIESPGLNPVGQTGRKIIGSIFPQYKELTGKEDQFYSKLSKGVTEWGKEAPFKTKGTAGEFIGGMLPFIGIAATTPFTGPVGVAGSTAAFTAMGLGEGLEAYDSHKKQSGEPVNPAERAGVGILYASVYSVPLGNYVGKMVPKGAISKGFSKVFGNPEAAQTTINTGKEIFEAFAKKNPSGAKRLLQLTAEKSGHGILTMEGMELSKMAIDDWAIGRDVSADEFKQRTSHALVSGAFFGLATAPFAHYAQNKATTNRRNAQGEVSITIDPDGNPVEVLPINPNSPPGPQKGMTPNGKIVDVSDDMLKNTFTIPTELFNQQMDQVKGTGIPADYEKKYNKAIKYDTELNQRLLEEAKEKGDEASVKYYQEQLDQIKNDPEEFFRERFKYAGDHLRDGKGEIDIDQEADMAHYGYLFEYSNKFLNKGQASPTIERDAYQGRLVNFAKRAEYGKSGKIATVEDQQGNTIFVKGGDVNDPAGEVFIVDAEGRGTNVKGADLKPETFKIVDQGDFVKAYMENYDNARNQQPPEQQAQLGRKPVAKTPRDIFQEDRGKEFETFKHESGNNVFVTHDKFGPIRLKIATIENGKITDRDGSVIAYDPQNPVNLIPVNLTDIVGDPVIKSKEEFINDGLVKFDGEQKRQDIAKQNSFEIGGVNWIDTGQQDEEGNHLIERLDDQLNATGQQEIISPEDLEAALQTKQAQQPAPATPEAPAQPSPEPGKPKTEVKSATWGKTKYQYTKNPDGTSDVLIPNKIPPAAALREIQKHFEDNTKFEAVPVTEDRIIPAEDDFTEPTKEPVTVGVKIIPRVQPNGTQPIHGQQNGTLKGQQKGTKPTGTPKYMLGKEPIPDRETVEEIIKLAIQEKDPATIKDLKIEGDDELLQKVLQSFPELAPSYTIAGNTATLPQIKARLLTGKGLDDIQIKNDPEIQSLLDKAYKKFFPGKQWEKPASPTVQPEAEATPEELLKQEIEKQRQADPDYDNKVINSILDEIAKWNNLSDFQRGRYNLMGLIKKAEVHGLKLIGKGYGKMYDLADESGKVIKGKRQLQSKKDEIATHKTLNEYDPDFIEKSEKFFNLPDSAIKQIELFLPMDIRSVRAGIRDIREGEKTPAANNLLDNLEKIFESGIVPFKPVMGQQMPDMTLDALFDYYLNTQEEISEDDIKKAELLPDDVAEVILTGQPLTEEQYTELFNIDEIWAESQDLGTEITEEDEKGRIEQDDQQGEEDGSIKDSEGEGEVRPTIEGEGKEARELDEFEKAFEDDLKRKRNKLEEVNTRITNKRKEFEDIAKNAQKEVFPKPGLKQGEIETPLDLTKANIDRIMNPMFAERDELSNEIDKLTANRDQIIQKEREKKEKADKAQLGLFDQGPAKVGTEEVNKRIAELNKEFEDLKKPYEVDGLFFEDDAPKEVQQRLRGIRIELSQLEKQKVSQEAAKVNTNPSEAQKKAGNYQKGHVTIQGMDISIENPAGSVRSGTDSKGNNWENKLNHHYGYFLKTEGKDGDHIDTFINPDFTESDRIYVVDQNNPDTGEFDESKVMIGFNSHEEAKQAYLSNYDKDWAGFRNITEVDIEPFKKWLYDGARQRKPFAEYKDTPAPEEDQSKAKLSEISKTAAKYGWTTKEDNGKIQLFNRNAKHVANVIQKGDKYTIQYPDGARMLSGDRSVSGAVETVIRSVFFGVEIPKIEQPTPEPVTPPEEKKPYSSSLRSYALGHIDLDKAKESINMAIAGIVTQKGFGQDFDDYLSTHPDAKRRINELETIKAFLATNPTREQAREFSGIKEEEQKPTKATKEAWEMTRDEFYDAVYNKGYEFQKLGKDKASIQHEVHNYHLTTDPQNKAISKNSIDTAIEQHYGGQILSAWKDGKNIPDNVKADNPKYFKTEQPSEQSIINPIDPSLSQEEKARALRVLSEDNLPIVEAFLKKLDNTLDKVWSKTSFKEHEKIIGKANRPEIKKIKPWFDVEHIRDGFRFKTVLDNIGQIEDIINGLVDNKFEIVKPDFDKQFSPKEWGWRFVAFDLRMPNGQLVEYYMPVTELEEAKGNGNHDLFEKWRNKKLEELTESEQEEYEKDLDTSWNRYQEGWNNYLNRQGLTESEALASFINLLASASSKTGLKLSLKSSAENILLRSQTPSTNLALKPSKSEANTLPSSETETKPYLGINNNFVQSNIQNNPVLYKGITPEEFIFLYVTKGYKSPFRDNHFRDQNILGKKEDLKKSLYKKGLLMANGGITETGRNLVREIAEEARSVKGNEIADYIKTGYDNAIRMLWGETELQRIKDYKAPKEPPKMPLEKAIDKAVDKVYGEQGQLGLFDTPEPVKKDTDKATDKVIGKNEEGQDVYQDKKGARYFFENGLKRTQLVGITPTGPDIYSPEYLHKRGSDEFLTKEELDEFRKNDPDNKAPQPKPEAKNDVPKPQDFPDDWRGTLMKTRYVAHQVFTPEELQKMRDEDTMDWGDRDDIIRAIDEKLGTQQQKPEAPEEKPKYTFDRVYEKATYSPQLGNYRHQVTYKSGESSKSTFAFYSSHPLTSFPKSFKDEAEVDAYKDMVYNDNSGQFQQPAPAPKPQPVIPGNKINNDKYNELLKKLKDVGTKNKNQGEAGEPEVQYANRLEQLEFDPEMFSIGAQLAMMHFEAGNTNFESFATQLINDATGLGFDISPYVKSFYEGARMLPQAKNYQLDTHDFVDKFKLSDIINVQLNKEQQDGKSDHGPVDSDKGDLDGRSRTEQAPKHGKGRNSKGLSGKDGSDDTEGDLQTGGQGDGLPDSGGSATSNTGPGGRSPIDKPDAGGRSGEDTGKPELEADKNFVIDRETWKLPTGEMAKIKANVDAIKLLRKLQSENRNASPKEKLTLSKYVGWGGLKPVFDYQQWNDNWKSKYGDYYDALKTLLSVEEFDAARKSVLNAHYTDTGIIEALWGLAKRLGFNGGTVLEPAGGIGHFFGLIPSDLRSNVDLRGYELDPITGGIFQKLYPKAAINITGYEHSIEPDNTVDLVITNVPFGDYKVFDAENKDVSKWKIHNYFIAKTLKKLKPGGISIVITTAYTMDSHTAGAEFRKWVNNEGNADFMGAIRLPNNAFKENAGTEVTTDVLVFRKRMNQSSHPDAKEFTQMTSIRKAVNPDSGNEVEMIINQYFASNPDMMLGQMKFGFEKGAKGLYGNNEQQVLVANPGDIYEQLDTAIKKLPEGIFTSDPTQKFNFDYAQQNKEGEIVIRNGKLFVIRGGVDVPLETNDNKVGTINSTRKYTKAEVFVRYKALKKSIFDLLVAELNQETTDEELAPLRKILNKQYDQFTREFGHISGNTRLSFLKQDIDWNSVEALENVTRDAVKDSTGNIKYVPKVTKIDIFSKRVNVPVEEPTKADNIHDALTISLSYKGKLDLPYISSLLGKEEFEVKYNLIEAGEAFINPATGLLEDKNSYLSGNVKEKLQKAEAAQEKQKKLETGIKTSYEKNIDELKKVQPKDIIITKISKPLGSPWMPPSVIEGFIKSLIPLPDHSNLAVTYTKANNKWEIHGVYHLSTTANNITYGTERVGAIDLISHSLNGSKPVVYDTYTDEHKNKTQVKNLEATLAAQDKQQAIDVEYSNYILKHTELHPSIERAYNDVLNTEKLREWEVPAFKHFPGASPDIDLRDHVRRAVLRCLVAPTLLAHGVGTGKTYLLITAAMEMRRLGIAKKPLIVVQKATIPQFAASFRKLYPQARLLIPSNKDLKADERINFFNKIIYGDWDAIIIHHDGVKMIPDDPARVTQYIRERIDEIENEINELGDDRNDQLKALGLKREIEKLQEQINPQPKKKTVRQRETAAARAEEKIRRQADRAVDDVQTFEKMGIDALLIDEAHAYKRLGFRTNAQGIKGIDTAGSKASMSIKLKSSWILEKNNNRNVVMATGTPISNTAAEVWTYMRYLIPGELSRLGINDFDQFKAVFGSIVPSTEFTSTREFKTNDRFKSYENVPELQRIFRRFTDVVLAEDIDTLKAGVGTPELKDGKYTDKIVPQTPVLEDLSMSLRDILRSWNELPGKEKRRLRHIPLVIYTRSKQAALDVRLVDPMLEDHPGSKANVAVKEIFDRYTATQKYKGTQLVFTDMYQSSKNSLDANGKRFNLFLDMKSKLVKLGIPENEIAIINDYKSDSKRDELYDKVNKGDVRIVFGGTSTMGTGVNVQERLYAIHHMDAPNRPMDFEQRNGRIIRQGNLHLDMKIPVEILRYGVEKTLDATAYQRLDIKGRMKTVMLKWKETDTERSIEEDDEDFDNLSFDEMMATLTGSRFAEIVHKLNSEVRRLEMQRDNHFAEQSRMISELSGNEKLIPYKQARLKKITDVIPAIEERFSTVLPKEAIKSVEIDGKVYKADAKDFNKNVNAAIEKIVADEIATATTDVRLLIRTDKYYNPDLGKMVIKINGENLPIIIDREGIRSVFSDIFDVEELHFGTNDYKTINGLWNGLIDVKNSIKRDVALENSRIEELIKDNEEYRKLIGAEFPKQAELETKTAERDKAAKLMEEEMAEQALLEKNREKRTTVTLDEDLSEDKEDTPDEAEEPQAEYSTPLEKAIDKAVKINNGENPSTVEDNQLSLFPEPEKIVNGKTYTTQKGETIAYKSSGPSVYKTDKSEVQKGRDNIPSENDIFCAIERQISENKFITLTGEAKIQSPEDIAYLFRSLETAAVENAFVVLHLPKGKHKVIYIGTGTTTGVVVDPVLVATAAVEFGAESITFVHNHPSGNLQQSDADNKMHKLLEQSCSGICKVNDSVIIDLDKGLYAVYNKTFHDILAKNNVPEKEYKAKVYSFDRQILYSPANTWKKVTSSSDVSQYLSYLKRGTGEKYVITILNRNNLITRVYLTDKAPKASDLVPMVGKYGNAVIISTNTKNNGPFVSSLKYDLQSRSITLLDWVQVEQDSGIRLAYQNYMSYADEGLLNEGINNYGEDSVNDKAEDYKKYPTFDNDETIQDTANERDSGVSGREQTGTNRKFIYSNGSKWNVPTRGTKGETYARLKEMLLSSKAKIFDSKTFDTVFRKLTTPSKSVFDGNQVKGDNPANLAFFIYKQLPDNIGNNVSVSALNLPKIQEGKVQFLDDYLEENHPVLYRRTSEPREVEVNDPATPLETVLNNAAEVYKEKRAIQRTWPEVRDGYIQFWKNKDLPVKRIQEDIIKLGGKLSDNSQPYRAMDLAKGRLESLYTQFVDSKLTPVHNAVGAIIKSGTGGDFILPYMIAKHTLERNPDLRAKEVDQLTKDWVRSNPNATQDEIDVFKYDMEQELIDKDYSGIMHLDKNKEYTNPEALAHDIVSEFESQVDKKLVDDLWKANHEAGQETLKIWYESSTMSKEDYDYQRNRYKNFVPLRGWREGAAKELAYHKGEGFGRSLQKAGGRTSLAENPLAYMQSVAFKALGEQVDNEVRKEMLNLLLDNYRVKGIQKLVTQKQAFYVKVTLPDGSFEWEIARDQNGELFRPPKDWFENGDAKVKVYSRHEKLRTPGQAYEHEVLVRTPNMDVILVFPDKMLEVAHSLNHSNSLFRYMFSGTAGDAEKWNRPLAATIGPLNNWTKAMYTSYNIVFPFTNLTRDSQEGPITQWIKGENGIAVLKNYTNSFPAIIRSITGETIPGNKYDDLYKRFRLTGGITGFTHSRTIEEIDRQIGIKISDLINRGKIKGAIPRNTRALVRSIETYNRIFEDATRFSVFISAIESGKTDKEAASMAKEATVNFNRKGKITKAFDSVWAFFNVALENAFKNFGLAKRFPARFWTVAGGYAASGFIMTLLNDLLPGSDDDDYYNVSDYARRNYICVPNLPKLLISGEKGNKYFRLPIAQFWRGFYSAGSLMYDVMKGKEKPSDAVPIALSNFIAGLSPVDVTGVFSEDGPRFSPIAPTTIKPIVEAMENRNFLGQSIYKEPFTLAQKEDLANSGLAKENVNPAIKFVTDLIFKAAGGEPETGLRGRMEDDRIKKVPGFADLNPSIIEHLLKGYTGGTGGVITDAFTTAAQIIDPKQEVDFRNIPFINSFIRKVPEAKWKTIRQYYDLKDEVTDYNPLLRAYKKDMLLTGDATRYKSTAKNMYYREYQNVLKIYDGLIEQASKGVDYKTGEGTEDVIKLMQQAITRIDNIKIKYDR